MMVLEASLGSGGARDSGAGDRNFPMQEKLVLRSVDTGATCPIYCRDIGEICIPTSDRVCCFANLFHSPPIHTCFIHPPFTGAVVLRLHRGAHELTTLLQFAAPISAFQAPE